jgi:hypothetical protein
MKIFKFLSFVLSLLLMDCTLNEEPLDSHYVNKYNVVWQSPSKDATGQMPLGNGDIAAGVYAIEDGDLYLLLSKNDAYEAQDGLIHRFRHASTQCRFPIYGSQGPDSCPDFDHFGAGSTALQRILPQQTVISGEVKDGKLVDWSIEPVTRKDDVTVYQPQSTQIIASELHP